MEVNPNHSENAKHDFKLVESAKAGDQKAYAELLGRYRDAIYFMLLKMINNKSDADDLTIEAFGKAFKNIHQYSPEYAFSTWLFKIASNNCIDYMRKAKNSAYSLDQTYESEDSDPVINIKSDTLNPEERLIKNQRKDEVKLIISKLKPRYKKLIQLRYFEELSYEEISQEMNLPVGTVKARLFRARDFLHNVMKDTTKKF